MSTPTADRNRDNPMPEDLAGIAACHDDDNLSTHVRFARGTKLRGSRAGRPATRPPLHDPPTADDLAGISVTAEEHENQTVRRRKGRKR